jgi:glycosyltransferase involved in cell wall biosynthesis
VAVVPSIWPEPFGLVALEAMAAGRPVIASAAGALPEILGDGKAGVLVPPGDPGALRAALERLLGDPALRQRLADQAARRAREFGADAVVPRVEAAYRTVAGD